ncbi:hypothetical protein GLOTRDRAFT_139694 [Gloeophyllum trabeum ATCC 11539]|uniref:Restriction endonuclease type IV Mrr domain-containing protein n=1 Tax=Gloeophyllum trabeum (strain ATCC 11539 / FP-39264 / Madison 617) TaxID=670483 RepID=S7Q137_GLOTA|nr:uncharacterized protein GLOTRDRAFT_139694 [Gloeophyllum trabeum ATCC 11539]EPQ53458.1 hypothetical protein GLOTRDRAFT_139694 [Gloeophyllum trabeum ATCC 11539]
MVASAVHRGVAFELRSLRILQAHLSMSLQRVGGKADGGVDLQGWWWLPSRTADAEHPRRVRVLAQCKAEKKKMGPNYVREMEGVMSRQRTDAAVALLISESAFTAATLLRANSSSVPFFLLHFPAEGDGAINAAFWNPALAGESGILGGEIDIRWEREPSGGGGRPGLWYKGERLRSLIPPLASVPESTTGLIEDL